MSLASPEDEAILKSIFGPALADGIPHIGWIVVERLDEHNELRVKLLPRAGCKEHYAFDLPEPVALELLYALAAGLRECQ